jgi:hypothetical protein
MNGLGVKAAKRFHLRVANAAHFAGIVRAAHANVALHFPHALKVVLAPHAQRVVRALIQSAHNLIAAHGNMRVPLGNFRRFAQGDGDLVGAIECFNQNMLACGKFDGVIDKKISQTTNAWIGQHERKCSRR